MGYALSGRFVRSERLHLECWGGSSLTGGALLSVNVVKPQMVTAPGKGGNRTKEDLRKGQMALSKSS